MVSLLIVLAILLAIVLGYRTKINTGFFAIVLAYLIGCFAMGLKPKDVISGWPISTMFIILAVSLFYNFALVNGTLTRQQDIFSMPVDGFRHFCHLHFILQLQ